METDRDELTHPPNIWNKVRAHKWDDETYRAGLRYVRPGSDRSLPREWTADARYAFRNRMKWYASNEEGTRIVFRTRVPPPDWGAPSTEPDGVYQWTVIPVSEVFPTLHRLRNDPMTASFSRDGLYNKAFVSGVLGVTRALVQRFLLQHPVPNILPPDTRGSVQSYRPKHPLEHWQVDLIVMNQPEIREANKPYENILVIIDIFSKYTWLRPLKSKRAEEIAGHFQSIFLQGDIPKKIQTDQGTEFQGVLHELFARFHIVHIINDPYSPQTNGIVENRNKTIKRHIWIHFESFVDQLGGRPTKRYVDILDRIAFNLNNTKHAVTKLTPLQVHRGVHAHVPSVSRGVPSIELAPPVCETRESEALASRDRSSFSRSEARVYENRVRMVRERIRETADRREIQHATSSDIQVGSVVKIRTVQRINSTTMQFIPIRIGGEQVPIRGAQNPVGLSTFAFASKWLDRDYPSLFVVSQIVVNAARTRQYILYRKGDTDRLPIEHMRDQGSWDPWFPIWSVRLASAQERRSHPPTRPTYLDPLNVSLPDPVLVPRSIDFSRLRPRDVRSLLQTPENVIGRRIRQWWRIEGTDRLEPFEGAILSQGTTRRGLPGWVIRYDRMDRTNREYDIPLYPTKYNQRTVHEGWIFLT